MTTATMWGLMHRANPNEAQRLGHLAGLLACQERADLTPDVDGSRIPQFSAFIAELVDEKFHLSAEGVSFGMVLATAFNPHYAERVLEGAVNIITSKTDARYAPHSRRKCGIVLGIFEVMLYLDEECAGYDLARDVDLFLPRVLERLLLAPSLALDEVATSTSMWPEYSRFQGRLSEAVKKYVRCNKQDGGVARREVVQGLLLAAAHEVNYPTPRAGELHTVGKLTSKLGYEVLDHLWYAWVGSLTVNERLAMITWLPEST